MSRYPYGQYPSAFEEDDDLELDPRFYTMPQQDMQVPSYYQQTGSHQGQVPERGQMQSSSNTHQRYAYQSQYMAQPSYPQQMQQQPQYAQQLQQRPQYQQSLPQWPQHQQPQYQFAQRQAYQATHAPAMFTPMVPSSPPYEQQTVTPFPPYSESASFSPSMTSAGPSSAGTGYLSPNAPDFFRSSRSESVASNTSSVARSDTSARSLSPSLNEMQQWGYQNEDGRWSCRYPGCSSQVSFSRGCDLRKHYRRHAKTLFCRVAGCPQATTGGFSSKKDRARHEAKHNPSIPCSWEGCDRVFSRVDNMRDHVRRVHRRHQR